MTIEQFETTKNNNKQQIIEFIVANNLGVYKPLKITNIGLVNVNFDGTVEKINIEVNSDIFVQTDYVLKSVNEQPEIKNTTEEIPMQVVDMPKEAVLLNQLKGAEHKQSIVDKMRGILKNGKEKN